MKNLRNPYLERMMFLEIVPNFWCSEEYFRRAGLVTHTANDIITVWDDDVLMFPPLGPLGPVAPDFPSPISKNPRYVWSDFAGLSYPGEPQKDFLDYEFIFHPKSFLSMEGGDWQVFRKNSRKFPKRTGSDLQFSYVPLEKLSVKDNLNELMMEWLTSIGAETEVEDSEVMIAYLQNGENRKVLVDQNGKIYGINIWDENYCYVNFRYCICGRENYISEYMRLMFYLDMATTTDKLVNDGGSLGRADLQRFKEKMNPHSVREVFSLRW